MYSWISFFCVGLFVILVLRSPPLSTFLPYLLLLQFFDYIHYILSLPFSTVSFPSYASVFVIKSDNDVTSIQIDRDSPEGHFWKSFDCLEIVDDVIAEKINLLYQNRSIHASIDPSEMQINIHIRNRVCKIIV